MKLGWTQRELAEEMGTDANTIARLERGEKRIRPLVARFAQLILKFETRSRRKK